MLSNKLGITSEVELANEEERITKIDGIYMTNVQCESAKMIYDLKGDARMPRVILLCSILSILVFGIQFLLCCKRKLLWSYYIYWIICVFFY